MADEPAVDGRASGMFLIHAYEDRSFARRVASDLGAKGVGVWIGEVEMGVGDSLLEKITGASGEVDYLGVIISRDSARSDWVTRELQIAMSGEVAGKRVRVLPLLLRGGTLPAALSGTTYADFTSEPAYPTGLDQVLTWLGVSRSPEERPDRLVELSSSNPLLRTALQELRSDGISNATADALISAQVDDFDLSEFLSLVVRELEGRQLFGLALSLVDYIDRRGVGQEALDYCLQPGRLTEPQAFHVGARMQSVNTPEALVWCHSRLTSMIRSDPAYHSFLVKHTNVVLDRCFDEMAAYLLQPNRGPARYNVDSFEIVLSHSDHAGPFALRWIEWINDGYFDREHRDGGESARVLYLILNKYWGAPAFKEIVEAIHTRVHLLLKSGSNDRVRDGLYHLVAMVDAKYRGVERVLTETVPRIYELPADQRLLLGRITAALQAVVAYHENPSDATLKLVNDCYHEVMDADRTGITGHWKVTD